MISGKRKIFCLVVALMQCFHWSPCGGALAASKAEQAFKLYQNKEYARAAEIFDEHIYAKPGDGTACYYAALCNQQTGNMSKAGRLYRRVIELMPGSQLATYSVGILKQVDPTFQMPSTSESSQAAVVAVPNNPKTDGAKPKPKSANLVGPDEGVIYFKEEKRIIWVTVEIDGRSVQMALDTGAPGITIGKEQLRSAGVTPPSGKFDGDVGGSSNDATIGFRKMKASLKVGPYRLANANIQVIEQNFADPLLGQGFLQYFDYTVDQAASCIRLRRKDSLAGSSLAGASTAGYWVPFTFREKGRRIIVDVDIDGKKNPVMVDTGNSAAVLSFNSAGQAKKYGAPVPADAQLATQTGISGSGPAHRYLVRRIRLGPIEKNNALVSANAGTGDGEVPLLGQEFFEGWQYTVDMKTRQMHLLRR